ncbi:Protein NRT1/ PTR FAMILY 5.12 [Linum perenne]
MKEDAKAELRWCEEGLKEVEDEREEEEDYEIGRLLEVYLEYQLQLAKSIMSGDAMDSSSGGGGGGGRVVEVAEIFAYYGISSNLITYLTGPLGQSTTFAFENVNAHMAIGISETLWVVVYVQDNLSWAVGFAIPCFTMFASLVTFIIGRSTYRFSIRRKEDRNPFLKIGRVIVRAVRRSSGSSSSIESGIVTSEEGKAYMLSNHSSEQFLNEALFVSGHGSMEEDYRKAWWDHDATEDRNRDVPSLLSMYVVCGISDVFTIVGLQEFFYEEVSSELKSLGLSFYLGVLGVGSFLSSFIVSLVDEITGGRRRRSWFDDDLNKAHLDYFYWLLAVLSGVWFVGFLCYAKTYVYRLK